MHDVALVDQSDACPASQRRGNRRVVELAFRVVDGRLVALNLRFELRYRGALGTDLLFGREIARRQIGKPLQVELCIGEVGLVLNLYCLIVRGLKRSRIDLRQEIARPDVLASVKATFTSSPSTRVLIVTVLNACTVPSPVR